jgi:L-lactate utilization protein LutC
MNSSRDSMLQQIRDAVREGNRAGDAAPLPERGNAGYQGAGDDPAARFQQELTAVGGKCHRVPDASSATACVLDLLRAKGARRVVLGRGGILDSLNLATSLANAGIQTTPFAALAEPERRAAFFVADVGITGAEHLVAETGTAILATRPDQLRSLSLLPPVHILVAGRSQILPDLFDLFALGPQGPPACLTLITGPSKTGDIELTLVTGVHGPGELHVVLIDGA